MAGGKRAYKGDATAYDAFYQAHRPVEEATPPAGSPAATPEGAQPGPPAQPSQEDSGFLTRWREFFRSLWERIAGASL